MLVSKNLSLGADKFIPRDRQTPAINSALNSGSGKTGPPADSDQKYFYREMQKSQSTKNFIKPGPAGDPKHVIFLGQKVKSMRKNRIFDFRQNFSEDEKVD